MIDLKKQISQFVRFIVTLVVFLSLISCSDNSSTDTTSTSSTDFRIKSYKDSRDEDGFINTYEYNDKGQIKTITGRNIDYASAERVIHLYYTQNFEYNGLDQLVKTIEIEHSKNSTSGISYDKSTLTKQYEYHPLGKYTTVTLYYEEEGGSTDSFSTQGYTIIYNHDVTGNIISGTKVGSYSSLHIVVNYDVNGNVSTYNEISQHSTYTFTYQYDSNNKLIKEIEGEIGREETTFTYYENTGLLHQKKYLLENYETIETYNYNEKGQLTEVNYQTLKNGVQTQSYFHTYEYENLPCTYFSTKGDYLDKSHMVYQPFLCKSSN